MDWYFGHTDEPYDRFDDPSEWRNVERNYMAAKKATKKAVTKKTEKTSVKTSAGNIKDFLNRSRKELENARKAGSGEFWKPLEGRSIIRIFPFEHKGETCLFVKDTRHWAIDGNLKSNVACPGNGCPICELKGDIDETQYGKIRPQTKYLVNAVVRKHDGATDKQVIAQLPKGAYTDLLAYAVGEDPDVENALDPEEGYDFKVVRAGKGLETKYTVMPMPAASAIGMQVKAVDLYDKLKAPLAEDAMEKIADTIREW